MNSISWLLLLAFNSIGSTLVDVFLGLFIWQKTFGLEYIYQYFIVLFLTIPAFSIFAGILSKNVSIKFTLFISFLTKILQILIVIYTPNIFLSEPKFFGLFSAFTIAMFCIPRNSIFQKLDSDKISRQGSIVGVVDTIVSLVIPVIGTYWISKTSSYSPIFVLAAAMYFLSMILDMFIKFPNNKEKINFSILHKFLKDGDLTKLFAVYFLNGLKNGLEWALMGLIVFILLNGNVLNWGLLKFLVSLICVIAGLIYAKILAGKYDKYALYFSSILYTFFGLFILMDFNFYYFVLFFVGTSLTSVFMNSAIYRLNSDVYSTFKSLGDYTLEFNAFTEIPLMLGRVIPLLILYTTKSDLESNVVLSLILFIISVIPLFNTYIIEKIKKFNNQ